MNYRLLFVTVLAVALLLLVGCATNTASGPSSGQPATSTPATSASVTPSQVQVAHVTISDNGISADRSVFYAGMPYHFLVTNMGHTTYQFVMGRGEWDDGHMMGRGEWDYHHMPMGWQHQMTPYQSYQITPGATTTFDYTFPASEASPQFGFGCYPLGGQGGMWYPSRVLPQP